MDIADIVPCSSRATRALRGARCAPRHALDLIARGVLLAVVVFAGAGCSRFRGGRGDNAREAEQLASEARRAADHGDPASAEYLLTAAVNSNPGDCETRLELSELLLEHGSLTAATAHLQRLVEETPNDPRAYVRLAQAQRLQNDVLGANESLDRALELDPNSSQAWMVRARIEAHRHDDRAALAACYQVLSAEPEHDEARLLVAEVHLRTGHAEQALPLLRSLAEDASICPQRRSTAAWLLGRVYANEGRWREAAALLGGAVRERPPSARDWYEAAYAQFRADDLKAARDAAAEALRLDPASAETAALIQLIDARARRTVQAPGVNPAEQIDAIPALPDPAR